MQPSGAIREDGRRTATVKQARASSRVIVGATARSAWAKVLPKRAGAQNREDVLATSSARGWGSSKHQFARYSFCHSLSKDCASAWLTVYCVRELNATALSCDAWQYNLIQHVQAVVMLQTPGTYSLALIITKGLKIAKHLAAAMIEYCAFQCLFVNILMLLHT